MDPYLSKINENVNKFKDFNSKRKRDGTLYRSRKDMKKSYDNSYLPYPFAAILKLDYCWKIYSTHLVNSLFFSVPLSLVAGYALNPDVRTKGFKSRPFVYYVSIYMLVYTAMTSYFMLDSLVFCEYCKPWSSIYKEQSHSDHYRDMLKGRIKEEQKSFDVQNKKTRKIGLKDEEI